jgi:hypothetical protein
MSKSVFFIIFWTLVLAPFEYFALGLPIAVVVCIRIIAVGTNKLFYKVWFEAPFWPKDEEIKKTQETARMVTMKLLVNTTNFIILAIIATLVIIPIQFSLLGFLTKALIVACFAIILTEPHKRCEKKLIQIGYVKP